MRMLIMGPPGSGKGTQAARIAQHLGLPAISTGDIFRSNVQGLTPLGLAAKKYMDAGNFVPDEITNEIILERLRRDDAVSGFLLDGYPRTTAQISYLDEILSANQHAVDAVLELAVDDAEIFPRLIARAGLEERSDDTSSVIRRRLKLYHRETEPIADRYTERGILFNVDGNGAIEDVTRRALDAMSVISSL